MKSMIHLSNPYIKKYYDIWIKTDKTDQYLYKLLILYIKGFYNKFDGNRKELHHIIPRCAGGVNDNSNLVPLSEFTNIHDHGLAHKYLVFSPTLREYFGEEIYSKLLYAYTRRWLYLGKTENYQVDYKIATVPVVSYCIDEELFEPFDSIKSAVKILLGDRNRGGNSFNRAYYYSKKNGNAYIFFKEDSFSYDEAISKISYTESLKRMKGRVKTREFLKNPSISNLTPESRHIIYKWSNRNKDINQNANRSIKLLSGVKFKNNQSVVIFNYKTFEIISVFNKIREASSFLGVNKASVGKRCSDINYKIRLPNHLDVMFYSDFVNLDKMSYISPEIPRKRVVIFERDSKNIIKIFSNNNEASSYFKVANTLISRWCSSKRNPKNFLKENEGILYEEDYLNYSMSGWEKYIGLTT